jgi:pimeloyl-ACP methyl ester carboxylesterase
VQKSRKPGLKFRARRAAAYAKTPVLWTPTIPTVLSIIGTIELLVFFLFPELRTNQFFIGFVGLSIPFAGWLFVYWKIYLSVFTTPFRERADITDSRWQKVSFLGWGDEEMDAYILPSETPSKELVLYLHGYPSSLGRGESRCLHLHAMGLNVIGLDQRGFGTQNGRMDWTLLKVVADAEALLETAPQYFGFTPERLWIYGHSMGGFITIRLASHTSGWWEHKLQGIILESPVTSFPKIINDKLPGRMVMARPWVRHVLRREHERIHPDLSIRYANTELPYMGIPETQILVMQSEEDDTLGRDHFDLLLKYLSPELGVDSEIHIISGMPHTSTFDHPERREILESWLEEMI